MNTKNLTDILLRERDDVYHQKAKEYLSSPVNGGRKLERWAVEKRSTLPNVLLPGGMSIPLFSMVI